MATPRSITVVHAGLFGAVDKMFPQNSSSGTYNHHGMPSQPRISKGTPGLLHPIDSQKNIAHTIPHLLSLSYSPRICSISPSMRLTPFLYLQCPTPWGTHAALSQGTPSADELLLSVQT